MWDLNYGIMCIICYKLCFFLTLWTSKRDKTQLVNELLSGYKRLKALQESDL